MRTIGCLGESRVIEKVTHDSGRGAGNILTKLQLRKQYELMRYTIQRGWTARPTDASVTPSPSRRERGGRGER